MRTSKSVLLLMMVTALVTFFTYTEAGAVANGDGECSVAEEDNFDCAVFNKTGNVLEFLGTVSGLVTLDDNGTTRPATFYFYKFVRGADSTNQLNLAIKLSFTDNFNHEKNTVNCRKFITDGEGDPKTKFGLGMVNHGICRTVQNLKSLPLSVNPLVGANVFIAVEPSGADPDMPIAAQVIASNRYVESKEINGPAVAQLAVSESAVTLTTTDGVNCQISIQGGVPVITGEGCPTGKIIPTSQTKLCTPRDPDDVNGFTSFTNREIDWQCETITFVSDQCDVKTAGTDPCRFYISGFCIRY